MPAHYPAWPSGAQVQAYLQSYVDKFNLLRHIHLSTEVVSAVQDPSTHRWTVATRPTNPDRSSKQDAPTDIREFDVLMVCNGTFSDGQIPDYKGIEEFKKAGGRVCHTSDFLNLEEAKDKHVVVVGYGKSSCDSAVALSRVAASTVSPPRPHGEGALRKLTSSFIDRRSEEIDLEIAKAYSWPMLQISVPGSRRREPLPIHSSWTR